ncbi:MAG: AAA family ATPase [Thermoleophilaceae bacterium]
MHLRSVSLKGFKSFPDRTKLEFSPGVSVVVGPNGSGKSNITDAVLWALGEQSPLAVRGQTMADVIFAGGAGLPSRNAAEVEVVLDNSEGAFQSEFSELSIVRRLTRDGEGEYRLNGARCRLVDVLEVLSDTGLGKEMHSVVSQGRVESIIHSKPRDRRLLIEEAAGLGKHRKRRRRAELKLARTEHNLSRALDVEREARSRLRPLKRQAEAAELHERLERQSLEARLELSRETVRVLSAELAGAEEVAGRARGERDEAERLLAEVAQRRERTEEAFALQTRARERLTGRLFAARSSAERIAMRGERARDAGAAARESAERRRRELGVLEAAATEEPPPGEHAGDRITALEAELTELDERRRERLDSELAGLVQEREQAERRSHELAAAAEERREAVAAAESDAEKGRAARRDAERAAEAARREAARVGAELAAANQFLRTAAGAPGGARSLADQVAVEPGFERALAVALGSRLSAGLVDDLPAGEKLLDGAGRDGGTALVAPAAAQAPGAGGQQPPVDGAEPLGARVGADGPVGAALERLLANVWVVESLEPLPAHFTGVAVTRAGRLFHGATGELHQAPAGGQERILENRNRRDELVAMSEAAVRAETAAGAEVEAAAEAVTAADAAREQAEGVLRAARREAEEAAEAARRAAWLIERRRDAPDEGEAAVRRAQVAAELAAERRHAERSRREAEERERRRTSLREGMARDEGVEACAGRVVAALADAEAAVTARREALTEELAVDEQAGQRTAAELRECAHGEAELQGRLKAAGEQVTVCEVRAQQVRGGAREAEQELGTIAERLGFEPTPAEDPLPEEQRADLEVRIERLARRREQLGPVNPLAKQEYEEAVDHVEELETQRGDLEQALAELEKLIKDTDRRIRESFEETFDLAAGNFEELVQHLFPGGRGRLRLVQPEGPRPVIGGQPAPAEAESAGEERAEAEEEPAAEEPGVEVEVTPAGKSMKRLSLLSGGEKSLVALAFMFAVFLARPCPFYILDEVEAALDDLNIDRFLQLVRRYSDRAQFIVVTHQKRTMDAADCIYGVSMGGDGVSKVVSRKLSEGRPALEPVAGEGSEAAA